MIGIYLIGLSLIISIILISIGGLIAKYYYETKQLLEKKDHQIALLKKELDHETYRARIALRTLREASLSRSFSSEVAEVKGVCNEPIAEEVVEEEKKNAYPSPKPSEMNQRSRRAVRSLEKKLANQEIGIDDYAIVLARLASE